MQLTTLARVRAWTTLSATSTQHDPMLNSMIASVSARIEQHLNRGIQVQLRTEDYNADTGASRFFLRSSPVFTTTAKYQRGGEGATIVVAAAPTLTYSPSREFTEDAEAVEQYHFRYDAGSVEFDFPVNYLPWREPGAFRAAYYGGLAYTLDQLTCSSTTQAGSLAVGDAVTGSTSGATGTVVAYSSGVSITVRVLSGIFEVGERFEKTSDTANYATFTAWGNTGAPLVMAYPELVDACNMQVTAWFQRREQMGVTSVSVGESSFSIEKGGLIQTVKDTLAPLIRYGMTY